MIGAPFAVLGLLLILSALLGAQVAGRPRGAIGTFVLSPLHPATWYATFSIALGFWVEMLSFSLVASGLSFGASTALFGIGIVAIGVTIEGCRLVARAERWRAKLADPRPLQPHAYRPFGSGLRDLLLAEFTDVSRWRDVVYVGVAFPLTILEFVASVVLWGISIALLCVPIWYVMAGLAPGAGGLPTISLAAAVVSGIAGLVMAPVAASASQGLMRLHRAVVAGLLCDSQQRTLERRVETLEGSRRAVLDVEATELRRIERDLHDGAQQRLVMLAINLSLAADRIDDDPAAARVLVVDAREQARLALAELRDLVRGIAPAILMDRGLVPALSAIAGRSPVPTVVASTLAPGERLPDATERAAYFVVAEALANVAKHASATRCEIRCRREGQRLDGDQRGGDRRDGNRLVVEVWDDGAGGARIVPGGGLAGLAGRVEALDGTLTVDSPSGGPTLVRAEMPVVAVSPLAASGPAASGPIEASAPVAGAPAPATPTAPAPTAVPATPAPPAG